MTGVLSYPKTDILSNPVSFRVYGVLDPTYAQYFGFTEQEVLQLLKDNLADSTNINQQL